VAKNYVPDRGDIVWLQFNSEAGRRPVFVVSPRAYNRKVGLALFCPVTSSVKGYPFEDALSEEGKVQGAILADQLKSLDWRARKATRVDRATEDVIQ
jgi:mRNA interferase MazF